MKKYIFTLCCAVVGTLSAYAAQDTLTASNIGSPYGRQMLLQLDPSSGTLPSFAGGANKTWNFSSFTYLHDTSYQMRTTAPSPYQFADSLNFSFDSLHYNSSGFSFLVLQGIYTYKQQIDTQTITVTKPSGKVDTMAIPSFENVTYTAPYHQLVFPLTYGTTWASNLNYTTSFNVTDMAMNIKHVGAYHRTYLTETDNIIGYGVMRVPTVDTNNTGVDTVLQAEITRVTVDSFHLPNVALFDSLGLQPVYTDTEYIQNFYHKDNVTPLAIVSFTDNSFTTVKSIWINATYNVPAAVKNIVNNLEVNIYPNPVTSGQVNVSVPAATNGQWGYQLVNVAGQTVAASSLQLGATNTHAQIALPSLPTGVYYIHLFNDNGDSGVKAILVK